MTLGRMGLPDKQSGLSPKSPATSPNRRGRNFEVFQSLAFLPGCTLPVTKTYRWWQWNYFRRLGVVQSIQGALLLRFTTAARIGEAPSRC